CLASGMLRQEIGCWMIALAPCAAKMVFLYTRQVAARYSMCLSHERFFLSDRDCCPERHIGSWQSAKWREIDGKGYRHRSGNYQLLRRRNGWQRRKGDRERGRRAHDAVDRCVYRF